MTHQDHIENIRRLSIIFGMLLFLVFQVSAKGAELSPTGSSWTCRINISARSNNGNDTSGTLNQALTFNENGTYGSEQLDHQDDTLFVMEHDRWSQTGNTVQFNNEQRVPELLFRGQLTASTLSGSIIAENPAANATGSFLCTRPSLSELSGKNSGGRTGNAMSKASSQYEWCWAAPLDNRDQKMFYSKVFAVDPRAHQEQIMHGFRDFVREQYPSDNTGPGECNGPYATNDVAKSYLDKSRTNSRDFNNLLVIDTYGARRLIDALELGVRLQLAS